MTRAWLPSHGFCFTASVLALSMPVGAIAQVVQEYEYRPEAIYPVRTGLGITTQIALGPDEVVEDFSSGFSNGWDLTRRGNVFYVKPRNTDVDTNLLVRTAARSYIFELKVVSTDWRALEQAKQVGVQYRVTFRYPGAASSDAAISAGAAVAAPASGGRTPVAQAAMNFDYDYAAQRDTAWLVPTSTYDDGRFTYLAMSDLKNIPTGNFPAVFGRDRVDGDDFVVNTTVDGNTIVVHGTYRFLVIRHGDDVVGLRRNVQP